jgi:hypothetical protein
LAYQNYASERGDVASRNVIANGYMLGASHIDVPAELCCQPQHSVADAAAVLLGGEARDLATKLGEAHVVAPFD